MSRKSKSFLPRLRRWRQSARWAAYISKVNAMKRQFRRLAADGSKRSPDERSDIRG
ncbi:hypothetical protein [Bradyrhizobium canariense]|uniref:hypothetical protein n=1 Tax=Bradyrhizobium canariense TaxID=255045 RepID=UPI0014309A86|nr:hypothetical protein [Bradyrhizobium canariense]